MTNPNPNNEAASRDWANLPQDVLMSIFEKTGPFDLVAGTRFVCQPWRKASKDPSLWQRIDMLDFPDTDWRTLWEMAEASIDMADGQVLEFWVGDFAADQVLSHLADRNSNVRCLRIIMPQWLSEHGLSKTLCRLPLLEELELTYESNSTPRERLKMVSKACPQLKYFRYNRYGIRRKVYIKDDMEAFSIAYNMPQLRRLQILGNMLTNKGLLAILDKCVHLEFLDLRCCFHVNMDANIQGKCARIKELRLPCDAMDDDFGFEVYMWDDRYMEDSDDADESSFRDTDYCYDDYLREYSSDYAYSEEEDEDEEEDYSDHSSNFDL